MSLLFLAIIFILVLAAVIVGFWWLRKIKAGKLIRSSFQSELFLIKIPSGDTKAESEKKPLKEKIAVAEQFLSSLAGLEKPVALEIAQENIGGEIRFYLAITKESAEFVENQLVSLYPGATVDKIEDYNIFNPEGKTAGIFLRQKESWVLPIRTYTELEADTVSPILSSFSKIQKEGEGLAFQVILMPAPKSVKKELEEAISQLKEGKSFKEALGGKAGGKILAESFKGAFSQNSASKEEKEKPKPADEESIKSLQLKLNKTLFSVDLRIVASAGNKPRAEEILNNLFGSFQQFKSPTKNSFLGVKPRGMKNFIFNYIFRVFSPNEKNILNTEEIASFWHFPVALESAPSAKWTKSKESAPPLELPEEGVILGKSVFRGEEKLVRMTKNDRRRHFYIIGQTGTGKSYMMTNMIIQDIKNGDGVCVIDPHGDLVDDLAGYIPEERKDDVIVFNPGDLEYPLGLNMLEYDFDRPEQKTFIINELMSIFDKLYDLKVSGGPMFEQYLRNALGLIMADRDDPATLLDVQRVFTNEDYREAKLKKCSDPTVLEFWQKVVAKITSSETNLESMASYITSKFSSFVSNDYMRPIVAQVKSAFNFRDVMDNQKILLVNLAKGRIGDLNASLLGLVFVGKMQIAALSRTDISDENKRKDFYLYIDEFQNFTTPSISTILSEARKYRLCLVLAHQFIAQLDEKIRESVFGNVGTMSTFRISVKDAEFIEKYFSPVFNQNDIIGLDNFHAIIRMLAKNQPIRPFNFETIQRESSNPLLAQEVKEMSRRKYGRDRQEIERMVRERYLS